MSEIVSEKTNENFGITVSSMDNDFSHSSSPKSSEKIDKNKLSVEYFIENKQLHKSANSKYIENNYLHNRCLEAYSEDCPKCAHPYRKPNAIRILNLEEELAKHNRLNKIYKKDSSCCSLF
ncbi:hypothetical protein SteCoe_14043 [Stentor coeruleus]|uniref:Uncharacterized protein n=1 Tax=Stentor coeruleus TaxID=5963 RepID=A0A1R2C6Z7_9CILI|nr:hypothetical protein SteCoe_14043 [Stentor coeruleus]